ncbi:MAG: serine hydrolase domain-containing protein [Anaerolineales bacterium]
MEDYAEVRSVEILHKLGLTEEMVRDHVMLPDHVKTAALHIELYNAGDGGDDPSDPLPPSGVFYRLNVEKLRRDLHDLLSGCVAGYSMQLRRYGQTIFDQQWNWAKTPGDGGVAWASDIPMHVASVSKLITAMAMTKLLYSRNISPDEHILPWLPKYWNKGPGVDRITFRQLLTHTSGLVLVDEPGPSDFQFMKDQIAIGAVGKPGYRNMNFGLCRILISTIDAPFLFDLFGLGVTDAYWDLTTIRYYARYVSENVFAPAGVTSTFDHIGNNALAYPYLANVPGWRSGDLSTMCGGVAWHLSVNDLLSVMATFRRRGTIVDPARAQTMLDRQFGIDVKKDTALGRIYAKGGFWSFDKGRFVEQSNVFFLPKGMELVILANSPFCQPDTGFMGKVLEAIDANIEINLFTLVVAASSAFAAFALFRRMRAGSNRR